MIQSRFEPFFLDSPAGRLFLLLRAPLNAERCVLLVPPFAEEMNKCRRQFTETARSLVEHGFAVLLVDLFGTGDSEGEFADASWDRWKDNLAATMTWIAEHGFTLDAVVAARLGCALVSESLREANQSVAYTVFWQPVDCGRRFMTRFLRLRVAASMMDDRKETVEELKKRLEAGASVEVAGYSLSPELWRAVESVCLSDSLDSRLGNLAIFEVGNGQNGELSEGSKTLLSQAHKINIVTSGMRIPGEPFWATSEIAINDDLVRRTTNYLTADASV